MPYWSADVTIVSAKSANVRWQDGLWSMTGDVDFPPDFLAELHVRATEALAAASGRPADVRSGADPQADALRVSSTTLHLIQAGSMVALCLFSGLFISFGAGLIWPR